MTAPMIEWTLEILDWIRPQLWENWPEAKMRGSSPELGPDGYKIRFRDRGRQFWLTLSPDAIRHTTVSDVKSALEAEDWIQLLRNTGSISVGVQEEHQGRPVLRSASTLELNPQLS